MVAIGAGGRHDPAMIVKSIASFCFLAAIIMPGAASASDTPIYAPAPAWIVPAPKIDPATLADAPVVLVLDNQQRIADGKVASYLETATRAANAEVMGQLGTISITWMPDKGDLTVHSAEILRGDETIDLLKTGERFSVLRREAQLEQRMLSGLLTATMAAQGLRIGDVLRVRFTITQADPALKGQVQTMAPVLAEPFRAQFARLRMSWPAGTDVKLRGYADGLKLEPVERDGFRSVEVRMPLPKQPDLPSDLPARFQRLPLIEATSFTDWSQVGAVMAPLYATEGSIAPGTALAGEVGKIIAAHSDPLARAAAALQLVQEQVRYLLMGMNGGNYVPQKPAQTWELRYGDCKAKTLLLLAMLREMGIESEAVMASAQGGDMVTRRLPMPGAFDHVIVRANIGGRSYWLDGTGVGARLADIGDTPPFRYVLPLRATGADLMPLPTHANARPDTVVTTEYDQSAGIDLPSVIRTRIQMRGGAAAMMNMASAQASAKQKRELIQGMVNEMIGEAQIAESAMAFDSTSGIATVTATGVVTTPWKRDQKRMRLGLDQAVQSLSFTPDRSRAAWRDFPVATANPETTEYRSMVKLPVGIEGFAFEGEPSLSAKLAGIAITRKATLASGVVTVEERSAATGEEIPPADIAAERQKVAQAKARELRLIAPANLPARWEVVRAARKDRRFAPVEAVYAKAIEADPEEPTGYESRLSFRSGVYDRQGALADLTKLIALRGEPGDYLRRATIHAQLGDLDKAHADAREALALDPGSDAAFLRTAFLDAERGNRAAAMATVQERIDLGGKDRFAFMAAKADLQADGGDAAGAVATMDAALAERPGDASMLNSRCWIKGTRNIALDSALKDCTKAIELADSPAPALDSRAMVYFRLGRMDEALADLDAALEESPNMAAALFLRAAVRRKLGNVAGAENDLAGARLIAPQIDRDYAKYGVKP